MPQQNWAVNSQGGHLTNNKLSKQLRYQALPMYVYRQFAQIKDEGLGRKSGDTVYFDKVLRINTKGGSLSETSTVPSNLIKVVKDSVVVVEWGNSVDYTKKLEDLAEWDVNNIFLRGLRDDMAEVLDSAAYVPFTTAKMVAVATSTASTVFTSNGTATATANASISDKNWRDIVDEMKRKQCPKIGGRKGYYGCILSIRSMRGVYDFLQAMAQYTEPEYRYNSEVGKYYDARGMEDNAFLSDAVGTSAAFGNGFFFGEDALSEAIAVPEYTAADVPQDLGRQRKVGWLGTMQFKKTWDLTNDDLNSTGKGIERIWRVTSA
jgi:N4-gp56 family major capsid protein